MGIFPNYKVVKEVDDLKSFIQFDLKSDPLMQNSIEPRKFEPPNFGREYGFVYPFAWRLLEYGRRLSLYHILKIESVVIADLYCVTWWLIEIVCLFLITDATSYTLWVVPVLCAYRYFDILNILLSILVRGFIKHNPSGQSRVSTNRTLLLTLANGLEITGLFAVMTVGFSKLFGSTALLNVKLNSPIDALYYSVVLSTTLGFGDILPTGALARTMAIIEVLSIFLIFVIVIGNISGQRQSIPNSEDPK